MCDVVIPCENDREAQGSLQQGLFGFARAPAQRRRSLLTFHSEAGLHLYLKSPAPETESLCFQDK